MTIKGNEEGQMDHLLMMHWKMAHEINGDADPLELLEKVLDTCMELEDLQGSWVWFQDSEGQDLKLRHHRCLDPATAEHLAHVPADSPLGRQLQLGNEVAADWETACGDRAPALRSQGWSDVAIWPLCAQGRVVGALGGASRNGGTLSTASRLFLRTTAEVLGGVIGRVQVEADLRNSRYNLKQLFQSFEDYVFTVDGRRQILYSNSDEANALSLGKNSPVGRNIDEYLSGFNATDAIPDNEGAPTRAVTKEGRLRTGNGRLIPVEVRTFGGQWDGQFVSYLICRDVSKQILLERERTRLTTAIEQSDDSILITNSAGMIQYTNPAFTRLTGYTREEARGATPRILKSGVHNQEFYHNMWATLSRGEVWKGRVTNRKKNGDHFIEVATISPVRDQNGVITHYVGVKRDVTNEVNLEDRLRQSQKMDAIGTLAGGLAHDFNNILYALLGYCQLAMDDVPAGGNARASLEEIWKAGNRASSLVAKMLTLGCRNEADLVVIELKPVVQEVLDLARASLPATIKFDVVLQDGAFGVLADPAQIHQVVLNLCTNAEHAMRENGGCLRVRLEEFELDGPGRALWPDLSPGRHMRLTIADTGIGMDRDIRERIFEPYFTTKDANEGTGLGLAMVQGIILNHEGRIYVESEPGAGTTFTLFFPISMEAGLPEQEFDSRIPAVRGSGRIVVVDDEPMIVELVDKALTKLGFTVAGYTDGLKAWGDFTSDPESVDLVITDQTMPNLTGIELSAKLLSIRPDLPIILTTGYSEQLMEIDLPGSGISAMLAKPLKVAALAEVVSELLELHAPKVEV